MNTFAIRKSLDCYCTLIKLRLKSSLLSVQKCKCLLIGILDGPHDIVPDAEPVPKTHRENRNQV